MDSNLRVRLQRKRAATSDRMTRRVRIASTPPPPPPPPLSFLDGSNASAMARSRYDPTPPLYVSWSLHLRRANLRASRSGRSCGERSSASRVRSVLARIGARAPTTTSTSVKRSAAGNPPRDAADGASAAAAAGRSRKRTIGTLAFSMSSHEPHSTSVERRALAATLRRSAAADGGGRAPAEPSGG